ncbi:kinetochore-associated protein DSN1 homolog [Halichoeres trimaculatus]|uniref:kinetochore-associated protein DSN1 homolog n=1 Tax=Halichoeres trimaculatus TaxID=147232 RepID=UPI003D9F3DC6
MAEKHTEAGEDGVRSVAVTETENEVNSARQSSKRCSSSSPGAAAPPPKSPRTESPISRTESVEGHSETGQQETQTRNLDGPSSPTGSPTARRKSWRRATITRRSLPAIQNQYQVLCRNINPSLPQQERFEKLIEASLKLAIERTQSSLQSVPNASMGTFEKQVEHMQKECTSLAKNMCRESQDHPISACAASHPAVEGAVEKFQKAIHRLQAESEAWESLLNKHQQKAEELEREVVQGQEKGLLLDSSSMTRSSQYHFIQSKPDYHGLLCRQQNTFHTMTMIMDIQCKKFRELQSIKEQSQLFVKETSGRLAAEAGFQDLSPNVVKNLMTAPLSSTTT